MAVNLEFITMKQGRLFRRFIHVNQCWYPFLYYFWYANILPSWLSHDVVVCILTLSVLILEWFRLDQNWVCYGQRDYEKGQISAVAWSAFAIALTLLFAPKIGYSGAGLGVPLIISMALGDPLAGELRIFGVPKWVVNIILLGFIYLLWWFCAITLATPYVWVMLAPPLMFLGEYWKISWIDDNALMILIPLGLMRIF